MDDFDNGAGKGNSETMNSMVDTSGMLQKDAVSETNTETGEALKSLHRTVIQGDLPKLEELLEVKDCNINEIDSQHMTPLHHSVVENHLDILHLLASKMDCDLNAKDIDERSPLHIALANNRFDAMKLLINDIRCDVNVQDSEGMTPLHCIIIYTDENIIDGLLRGKSYDETLNDRGVSVEQLEAIKQLLTCKRLDINIKDYCDFTPLHHCIMERNVDAVEILMQDERCDINAKDHRGMTPLHNAIAENDAEIVGIILQNGTCVLNASDNDELTPLHYAVSLGSIDVINLLLADPRIDINATDEYNQTPLHHAIEHKQVDVIKVLLLDKRCDINAKDNLLNSTPLQRAIEEFCIDSIQDIMKPFLQHPKISDALMAVNKHGHSVLTALLVLFGNLSKFTDHQYLKASVDMLMSKPICISAVSHTLPLAVEFTPLGICKTLISKGASVNSSYPEGETALHCAVRIDSFEKVKTLVDMKAKLDLTWRGVTPLQLAIANGCTIDILDYLAANVLKESKISYLTDFSFRGEPILAHAKRLGVCHWLGQEVRSTSLDDCLVSTLLPAPHKNGTHKNGICKALHNLIHCSPACNSSTEMKHISATLINFLKKLSLNLSNRCDSRLFTFNPVLAGGSSEGTKTFKADEFDIICVFTQATSLDIKDKQIAYSEGSPWAALGTEGYLLPRLVSEKFYHYLGEQLVQFFKQDSSFGNMCLHPRPLVVKDRISYWQFLWRGVEFTDMVVHVDLVPAFDYPEYNPSYTLPFGAICNQYHLITKISRHNYNIDYSSMSLMFQLSDACAEGALIRAMPRRMRSGYCYAKALRVATVSQPDDQGALQLGETISTEEVITSYMLKTCLLNLCKKRNNLVGTAYDWAEYIYEELERCTQEKLLISFSGEEIIFRCKHDDTVSRACCRNLNVIQSLCHTITKWLISNKRQLGHLNHGAHCVYSRPQHQNKKS